MLCFQSSFNRPNLHYEIRRKENFRGDLQLQDLSYTINKRFNKQSGIVYCISRKNCEDLAYQLKHRFGIKCAYYHANMNAIDRARVQQQWMDNEIYVIVATIAFGLGINKKDVRFVVHYSMPKSLEGYVQECGRSGRDGKNSLCILYYSYGDRKLYDFFLASNVTSSTQRKGQNLVALYAMLQYCEEPFHCRRKLWLNFLGEKFDAKDCSQMCDNCKANYVISETDVTEEAKTLIRLTHQCDQQDVDLTTPQLIKMCLGGATHRFVDSCAPIKCFVGCMQKLGEVKLRRLIVKMLSKKLLKEKFVKMEAGPREVICVYLLPGKKAGDFMSDEGTQEKLMLSHGVRKREPDPRRPQQAIQEESKTVAKGYQKSSQNVIIHDDINHVEISNR